MSKSLRLSEKWFRRGLWLVAFVFAGFLIGLGGTIVGDLPRVERTLQLDDFVDADAARAARDAIDRDQKRAEEIGDALDQARLKLQVAQSDVAAQRESFSNWIATRKATERAEQDPEVISRTRALDELQAAARNARAEVERLQQAQLDTRQSLSSERAELASLQEQAHGAYTQAVRTQELRVFAYRLALTLPLLLLAGWLLAKKRTGPWWPFVWGFGFFAVFAFFVELVPYLPSYGGYVRYGVGVVLTVLAGRWAIRALNRYLARQQAAETRPEPERRRQLSYDTALARLAKGVCPGCERPVSLTDGSTDFCPHCGIGLFDRCSRCDMRKSAFARFCPTCGAPAAPDAASTGAAGKMRVPPLAADPG
ncbi:MAG: serine endopeptidase [Ottowia sp.]|nr:serine endopeptidase [Ottowia sp.]